jgi:hypothetical protein
VHSDLFPSELGYQGALSLAEDMRRSGLLNDEEMSKTQRLLVDTYEPPLGSLFSIQIGNEAKDMINHSPQEFYDARSPM